MVRTGIGAHSDCCTHDLDYNIARAPRVFSCEDRDLKRAQLRAQGEAGSFLRTVRNLRLTDPADGSANLDTYLDGESRDSKR